MLIPAGPGFSQETVPSSSSNKFPGGKIEGPFTWTSNIYPGTERDYWIYVPAQYDPEKPACSMIVQDGLGRAMGWGLPEALDSLIHHKDLPVIIGIFIDHGKVPSAGPDNYPRYNRSFEYDALGDRYARFLLEEILPEIGRKYNLSEDPDDRSIAGASSGAICAFNAAWERPDAFRRVLSTIGTYVGLRGGHELATLVRKSEPKPIRVFLEDGNTDLNIYAGDWWMANQDMLSSLTWAGYEVAHVWGKEGHNSRGGKKVMADALKWLWKDYPQRVSKHLDQYQGLPLPLKDTPWQAQTEEGIRADKLAVGPEGKLFFTDHENKALYSADGGGQFKKVKDLGFSPGGLCVQPDGGLLLADLNGERIIVLDHTFKESILIDGLRADYLVNSPKGLYFTDTRQSRVGYYNYNTRQVTYVELRERPEGLSLSVDHTFLTVTVGEGVQAYSFKISEEGHLAFGQPYIHYHIPYGKPTPGARGITVDKENRTYTATAMGVQVADQLGRINFIFSKAGKQAGDVRFGGPGFDILYLVSDGQLYGRKIQASGRLSWQEAIKPPRPRM